MLTVTKLQRSFSFDNEGQLIVLQDPSPSFTPQAVQNFYAQTYPILTTAKVEGPEIIDDRVQYRFVSTIGTKG